MLPVTEQLVQELDILYGLYQLSLDFTRNIDPENPEDLTRWLDARQRLLSKTGACTQKISRLNKLHKGTVQVPLSESELIKEKKKMVSDVLVQTRHVENAIIRKFQKQMLQLREELVAMNKQTHAVKAYIQAPRASLVVG
jgi:hypothetical protein